LGRNARRRDVVESRQQLQTTADVGTAAPAGSLPGDLHPPVGPHRSGAAYRLTGEPGTLFAIAAALAAAGAIWIALQPAVTHSPLDGVVTGSVLRWLLYLPPTLLGVWLAAQQFDRAALPRPGPIRIALAFAAPAVAAGTLSEIAGRAALGHGDVLAADGVLQRVIELVRVDVPVGALIAIVLVQLVLPRAAQRGEVVAAEADLERSEGDAVAT
jgi:hypothetical protein